MSVSVIILAAGSSSRMGRSKQLLPWHKETLLTHSINTAIASKADFTYVVLGSNEGDHRKAIEKFPVTIVVNREWERGMGSSIKVGLEAAKNSDAVLIMVCDMPFVTTGHLDNLMAIDHPIVASKYQDAVGVPALFKKELFDDLFKIDDAEGARNLITNHKLQIVNLQSGIDVDTPNDYRNALSN